MTRMDDCEHDYEPCYCDRCGMYQGDECNHCGAWSDGGEYMAGRTDLWCQCGPFDDDDQGVGNNDSRNNQQSIIS